MQRRAVDEFTLRAAPPGVVMLVMARTFVRRLEKLLGFTPNRLPVSGDDTSHSSSCPHSRTAQVDARRHVPTHHAHFLVTKSAGVKEYCRDHRSSCIGNCSMDHHQECRLTKRDTEVLAMLCGSVRMASLNQIARASWGTSKHHVAACRRRLLRLNKHGMLAATRAVILDVTILQQPLITWQPGERMPNLPGVAWSLHRRWSSGYRSATIYYPTTAAARRFGGGRSGRIKRPFQVAHDIGVTEMYLAVRRQRPRVLSLWIGEDRLAPYRRRQKLPDAILATSPTAKPLLILEFGGRYDKRRLIAFHEDAAKRGIPYEIW
jgi:hypothetical protein